MAYIAMAYIVAHGVVFCTGSFMQPRTSTVGTVSPRRSFLKMVI